MYLEHIAAGKVYIEYLQQGYSLVRKGFGVISNIKDGHLSLDKLFFDGLVAINPRIRGYPHVADIMSMSVETVKACGHNKRLLSREAGLSSDLISYADRVTTSLATDCLVLLSDLAELLAAGHLQLSDDERIKRIDQVYIEMKDRYVFIQNWSAETSLMILNMKKEYKEAARMKSVYDLK
ncbi:hypothetical protein [Paraflavitalea sp. CAU 1676]|uniref:hypothetical protein n=1 Tax=Paraflavitalea sp. CAU 1676 TaxID=3032598 RepID=UPI0023D9FD1A|nr:hypothetical protein [Paraflavitalea sp. CAU 1676]MDF2188716.1 hypothetical protein [Paraflavitalea sp. CAU 1676]